MTRVTSPAIWLIILIVGLPQLSETVYTPSFPAIAHALAISEAMVEHTLTIYLFGFALGTLFWGYLSDKIGRKPCVLAGLFIFSLGCVGCFFFRYFYFINGKSACSSFWGQHRKCAWPGYLPGCLPRSCFGACLFSYWQCSCFVSCPRPYCGWGYYSAFWVASHFYISFVICYYFNGTDREESS